MNEPAAADRSDGVRTALAHDSYIRQLLSFLCPCMRTSGGDDRHDVDEKGSRTNQLEAYPASITTAQDAAEQILEAEEESPALNAAVLTGNVQEKSGRDRTSLETMEQRLARLNANEEDALFNAATSGEVSDVTCLLQLGRSVHETNKWKRTALSVAVEHGHLQLVEELIRQGSDIGAKSDDGRTALSYAVKEGRLDVVQLLIRQGADIESTDREGRNALSHAAQWGHVDAVQELITHGADIESRDGIQKAVLSYAAQCDRLEVVRVLLQHGANVEAKGKFGRTALSCAVATASVEVVRMLIEHGADTEANNNDGQSVFFFAADGGNIAVIQELIKLGANVEAKDKKGRTPLSWTAQSNKIAVVQELIKQGADTEIKDKDGRTALSYVAQSGKTKMAQVLIDFGANTESKDNTGKTSLCYAAERGRGEVIEVLIGSGVDINAKDEDGRTALSYAAERGHVDVVAELLRHGAFDESTCSDLVSLFAAAAVGDFDRVKELVDKGAFVDAVTLDGRTPLFYAAELGHMDVVQLLIDHGASVRAKSNSRPSSQECETPLILAGRFGRMETFEALAKQGAPVNVRSGEDGETPLISAVRWDFFAGVQLLIAHVCYLSYNELPEDERPLIPGTLMTMRNLCAAVFEFKLACSRVLGRLDEMCCQLQQPGSDQATEGTLVSLASIVFRFCRLLLEIKKRSSPLSRFIGRRAITNRIRDFHEELDHFAGMLSWEGVDKSWKDQMSEDQLVLQSSLEELLSDDEALAAGNSTQTAKSETAVLLQYELNIHIKEGRVNEQASLKKLLERFVRVSEVPAHVVPEWFIFHDDVEFYRWNIVRSGDEMKEMAYFEGKWRKTIVMVETKPNAFPGHFEAIASKWYQLNHPNVIKLFGACHIGPSNFFVYEFVPEGKHLPDFLCDEANRALTWKQLYEAALGLQYLHSHKEVHGYLRSENIVVGLDLTTKLCGFGGSPYQHDRYCERDAMNWLAPEVARVQTAWKEAPKSAMTDIYAFGMCIWEALTLELPWNKETNYLELKTKVKNGDLPRRPDAIGDVEWRLITKMCAADPSKRVDIAYVLNQLKQFILSSKPGSPGATIEVEDRTVEECLFAELDSTTIPSALQEIRFKSEGKLQGFEWMLDTVCPALEYIFALLRERQKKPNDVEVVNFCNILARFQRYLRTATSDKAAHQLVRSLRVAESQGVIYSELDRLLTSLDVPETDPIRAWRRDPDLADIQSLPAPELESDASDSEPQPTKIVSGAVTLTYCGSPSVNHRLWTQVGIQASKTTPPWYISLRDLVFSEAHKIGQGSFGAVYKGSWNDTLVVIKFMGYEEDLGTISTDLLLHEVRVWHRLNHPHVLKLYGACHTEKRYFVCELASNGDLLDFLKKPANEQLAWQKMYEVALGLEYLHEQNVAHNDLKCDNIMVGASNKAKLIDFGLSCLVNEAEIRIEKNKIGAVNWRSPEYLAGGAPSFASDVYSFAMCIIQVVSGEMPWGHSMAAFQVRFQWKKGNSPNLPESLTEKQRNLIQLMSKVDPVERVKMAFVVDKLNEIAQEEKQKPMEQAAQQLAMQTGPSEAQEVSEAIEIATFIDMNPESVKPNDPALVDLLIVIDHLQAFAGDQIPLQVSK